MKVLITGASKGFGFATANCYFLVGEPDFTIGSHSSSMVAT